MIIIDISFIIIIIAALVVFKHICKEILYMRSGEIHSAEVTEVVNDKWFIYKLRIKDGRTFTIKRLPAIYGSRFHTGDTVIISVIKDKALLIDSLK